MKKKPTKKKISAVQLQGTAFDPNSYSRPPPVTLTLRELREALSDPTLMEGDYTNIVEVRIGRGYRHHIHLSNS